VVVAGGGGKGGCVLQHRHAMCCRHCLVPLAAVAGTLLWRSLSRSNAERNGVC
jgi:hypothetical protein